MALSNAQVQAGEGVSVYARLYRELVASVEGGHDALCDAYGLDRDGVNGGTYWGDVIQQAILWGDIDTETGELA